jgi:WD40 repeat protein
MKWTPAVWRLHVVAWLASGCAGDASPRELYAVDASLSAAASWGSLDAGTESYSSSQHPPPSDCLRQVASFVGPEDYVYTTDWSPRSDLLLAGTIGSMRVLAVDLVRETIDEVITYSQPDSQVYVQWAPDGRYAVSAGVDVRLLRIDSDPVKISDVARYDGHSDPIIAVAWSRDGQYVLTGAKDETVRVLAVDRDHGLLEERAVFHGHKGRVFSVAWSPNGRNAVSAGEDGTLRVLAFDADSGKLSELAQSRSVDWKNTVTWGDGDRPVLSGDWGLFNRAQMWSVDLVAGEIIARGQLTDFDRVGAQVLEWNPTGSALAAAAHDDNGLQLFSYAQKHFTGRGTLKDWHYGVHAATWSPDSTHIAFASAFGERITLLDVRRCFWQ